MARRYFNPMFAYANVRQAVILSREVNPVNRAVVYGRLAIGTGLILEIHHENVPWTWHLNAGRLNREVLYMRTCVRENFIFVYTRPFNNPSNKYECVSHIPTKCTPFHRGIKRIYIYHDENDLAYVYSYGSTSSFTIPSIKIQIS